jgi:hypothetical protein
MADVIMWREGVNAKLKTRKNFGALHALIACRSMNWR